jgi:hypothetical protein
MFKYVNNSFDLISVSLEVRAFFLDNRKQKYFIWASTVNSNFKWYHQKNIIHQTLNDIVVINKKYQDKLTLWHTENGKYEDDEYH